MLFPSTILFIGTAPTCCLSSIVQLITNKKPLFVVSEDEGEGEFEKVKVPFGTDRLRGRRLCDHVLVKYFSYFVHLLELAHTCHPG